MREQIMERNGMVFVAGNSKNMPKAVQESLSETLDDNIYVETMKKSGRYQEETWA